MSSHDQCYTGQRILEAMKDAVFYNQSLFEKLMSAAPPQPSKFLDFGAGDGLFVRKFEAQGIIVDCVEPDVTMRSQLGASGASVYPDIGQVASASYRFVYTINVLEHIPDLSRACDELFRVIQPNGRLFVFVPAFELLWTRLDDEVGHVRRFTRASLSAALRRAGFEVRALEYFDSLGFPAAIAVRMLELFGLFRYGNSTIRTYDRLIFPISRRLDFFFKGVGGKNLVAIADKLTSMSSKNQPFL